MGKSDKEKELGIKVSELESTNANLVKSKKQMVKDIERLTENEVKAKEVQGKLDERSTQLTEAEKTIEQQGKHLKGLRIENQNLLTDKGQKSEQGEKIKSQQQEIEKLTSENENLSKKVAKTEGEFPKFQDPAAGYGRAKQVNVVLISKDEKHVAYEIERKNALPLLLQVRFKNGDCVDAKYSYAK